MVRSKFLGQVIMEVHKPETIRHMRKRCKGQEFRPRVPPQLSHRRRVAAAASDGRSMALSPLNFLIA